MALHEKLSALENDRSFADLSEVWNLVKGVHVEIWGPIVYGP